MIDNNQEQLVTCIRSMLDRKLEALEPQVQQRLDGIRRAALQHQSALESGQASHDQTGPDFGVAAEIGAAAVIDAAAKTGAAAKTKESPAVEPADTPQRLLRNDAHGGLTAAIVARLDDSNARLDSRLADRLDQARKNSLATVTDQQSPDADWRRSLWTWFSGLNGGSRFSVPAGAFAGLCVLVSAVTLVTLSPEQHSSPELAEADVLLFASSEDIELYDNLEFYLWLADNGLPN